MSEDLADGRVAQPAATPSATDYSRVKTRGGIIAP